MGWEDELFALFDDLEEQASALYAAERDVEVADRSRAEYQQVTLAGRLLLSARQHDWVVTQDAVTTVEGASVRSVPEVAWSPLSRLGLASALRRIAEAGEPCQLHLRDGSAHMGVLRRVGADFCELVEGDDRRMILVPFAALAAAQSRA